MGPTGELRKNDGGIEINVINLVVTQTAEELGAVDVDGDGVVGGVIGHVAAARDGGAGQARVEKTRGQAGPTERDVLWVPHNGGAAEWLNTQALLERSKGVGGVSGSEVMEVRARRWGAVIGGGANGRRHCGSFGNGGDELIWFHFDCDLI